MIRLTRLVVLPTAAVAVAVAAAPALAAGGGSYPPPVSQGQGTATPSRVGIGGCTTFAGGGFASTASLRIADDRKFVRTTKADNSGNFSTQVCFNSDAKPGKHTLTASGRDGSSSTARASASPSRASSSTPRQRIVSAVVYVLGSSETNGQSAGGESAGSHVLGERFSRGQSSGGSILGLPFTGFDALLATAGGLAAVVVGSLVLLETERRARRRRRQLAR